MKKFFVTLLLALFLAAVYAAEPMTAAAYIKAHYNDWPGVIAAEEAGAVALTGKYTADIPYHTARWYVGTLTDAGLYELTEAELASEKPNYPSAYLTLFRLGARATDEVIKAKAVAELSANLESPDYSRRYHANLYLSKIYAHKNVKNYAAIMELLKQGRGSGEAAKAAVAALLASKEQPPRVIFETLAAGLPELARRNATAAEVSGLVSQLCTAAKRANVPDVEVYNALRSLRREISDKAVGTTRYAQEWGLAVGKLDARMTNYR